MTCQYVSAVVCVVTALLCVCVCRCGHATRADWASEKSKIEKELELSRGREQVSTAPCWPPFLSTLTHSSLLLSLLTVF